MTQFTNTYTDFRGVRHVTRFAPGAEKITVIPHTQRERQIIIDYLTVYGYHHTVTGNGDIHVYIRANALELSSVRNAITKLTGSTDIGFAFHPARF